MLLGHGPEAGVFGDGDGTGRKPEDAREGVRSRRRVTLHSPPGATKEGQGPFPQTRPASVPALQDGLPWYFQAAQLFIGTRNSTPVLPQLACSFSEAHLM